MNHGTIHFEIGDVLYCYLILWKNVIESPMPRKSRIDALGAIRHVIWRGNGKGATKSGGENSIMLLGEHRNGYTQSRLAQRLALI
jgi:hypothetical protein